MSDFYLPPDLVIAKAAPSLEANTAAFSSPTVGSTRTVERLGDRYRMALDFAPHNDNASSSWQRGRLQAILSQLRGQANRIYLTPPGARLRGSYASTEVFTNGSFTNGTTGWTSGSSGVLSVTNRVLRAKRGTFSSGWDTLLSGSNACTQFAPYVCRAIVMLGRGAFNGGWQIRLGSSSAAADYGANAIDTIFGYKVSAGVPFNATLFTDLVEYSTSNMIKDEYFECPWTSLSRCALVDNSPNGIPYSDQIDNAAWVKSSVTVTANSGTAPDNTLVADLVVESSAANVEHYVNPVATVAATAGLDYTFQGYFFPARSWIALRMIENGGSSAAYAFFNISTGAIGTTSAGANWASIRATISPAGSGWYFCSITARKTNAATTINSYVNSATADNTFSYAGGIGTNAFYIWRGSFAQSSTPFKAAQTTTTAVAAAGQTGTGIFLKGLPVSSSGLLLQGDWVECNNQLNQVVGSLDSDAAGLGFMQLARPFRNSPADNAPFIVTNPLGKFMLSQNSSGWTENPGAISDASIELVEDISF